MANMTLSIPDEVMKDMRKLSDIRWSEVARRAIIQRVEELKTIERIASKSKLTQKDADELSEKIKRGAAKRFRDDNRY